MFCLRIKLLKHQTEYNLNLMIEMWQLHDHMM